MQAKYEAFISHCSKVMAKVKVFYATDEHKVKPKTRCHELHSRGIQNVLKNSIHNSLSRTFLYPYMLCLQTSTKHVTLTMLIQESLY